MTVNTLSQIITYDGDTNISEYYFPYILYEETDLEVWTTDLVGNVASLVLNEDYVIELSDDYSNAKVILSNPIDNTRKITFSRNMELTQPYDFTEGGGYFSAEVFEQSLDRLTLLIQQINSITGALLKLPTGSALSTTLPTAKANAFLGTNEDGTEWHFMAPDSSFIFIGESAPNGDDYSLWFDSDNRQLKYWSGSVWSPVGGPDSNKIDKIITNFTPGNLVSLSEEGGINDAGISVRSVAGLINNSVLHHYLVKLTEQGSNKGTILVMDGTTLSSIGVGGNGQVLVSDENADKGISWQDPVINPVNNETPITELLFLLENPQEGGSLTILLEPNKHSKIEILGSNIESNNSLNSLLRFVFGFGTERDQTVVTGGSAKVNVIDLDNGSTNLVMPELNLTRNRADINNINFKMTIYNAASPTGPLCFSALLTSRVYASNATTFFKTQGVLDLDQNNNYLNSISLYWTNGIVFGTTNGYFRVYGWRL